MFLMQAKRFYFEKTNYTDVKFVDRIRATFCFQYSEIDMGSRGLKYHANLSITRTDLRYDIYKT